MQVQSIIVITSPPPHLHLLHRHKLDQATDHLARLPLPKVNLLQVQRVGIGVAVYLRNTNKDGQG